MKSCSRRDFLRGTLGFGAAGMLTCMTGIDAFAEEKAEAVYTPGTYTSEARGHSSNVVVSVTFSKSGIVDVRIDASGETENIGGLAAPILADQIMKAQSSAIDGVASATVTSSAVRRAVANCILQASGGRIREGGSIAAEAAPAPGQAGKVEWLGEAPMIREGEIVRTIPTEVLVVGAGNAGLIAAARACDAGARVLVIEKAISSQTERHWLGAVNTKEQLEHGVEIDVDLLVTEIAKYASNRCDQRLIRLWANHSGAMMEYYKNQVRKYCPDVELHLEWDIGSHEHKGFYVVPTMHNFQDSIPEHDYSEKTANYGLSSLTSAVLDGGGEIMYETALVKLEQDDTGRVTGIIAKNAAGEYLRINASKGVALCCGGYPQNKKMLSALNPDAYDVIVHSLAAAGDTGDGIRAALWIGADKDPDPAAMLFDRGGIRPGETPDGEWRGEHIHFGSQPWLKVNLKGECFANESTPYDFMLHAGHMQPGHVYVTVLDSNWLNHVRQFHQFGCARIIPSDSDGRLQIFSPELESRIFQLNLENGFIQSGDTLEELAGKLGLPAETFAATVHRYNELCEKGVDEDFGKEGYRMIALDSPPYYGVIQGAQLFCTLDGIRINTNMQVLDRNGDPIEGLYCAGDCSGGFFAHNYPEYVVGLAVGRSLTEGYLLGEIMAKA